MKNKLLALLLSFTIAFGLWLYVITVVKPDSEETFYNVPVVLQGESVLADRGLMVTNEKMPTVTLKVAGNRTDLNKINASNITLIADVSGIDKTGEQRIRYTVAFPGNVPLDALSVQSRSPGMITLMIERQVTKEVPVSIVYSGAVPENFICDKENPILDCTSIRVTGPSPVVEQISQAKIEVDLNEKSETFSEQVRYTLCNDAGEPVDVKQVTTNVGEVYLTVKIQRVKEVKLVVTVIPGGGATELTSQIEITPGTIKVSGSDSMLEDLEEINIGTINLGNLVADTGKYFPIELPTGLTNLSGIKQAYVVVRFPDLKLTTFTITNIRPVNVPEGLDVEMVSKQLMVDIRGPKAVVAAMSESDIFITVDFTDAQIGTASYKATITFGPGIGGVGAVGTYTVNATVTEAAESGG